MEKIPVYIAAYTYTFLIPVKFNKIECVINRRYRRLNKSNASIKFHE